MRLLLGIRQSDRASTVAPASRRLSGGRPALLSGRPEADATFHIRFVVYLFLA